mgnify:CR=1 FL=1
MIGLTLYEFFKQIEQDLKHLRDIKFRKGQELFMAKKTEKDTNAEIQGTKAAIRNLDSKINKLDHDSLKQLEIIYNQVRLCQMCKKREKMHFPYFTITCL